MIIFDGKLKIYLKFSQFALRISVRVVFLEQNTLRHLSEKRFTASCRTAMLPSDGRKEIAFI